jgi:hypothetical protein
MPAPTTLMGTADQSTWRERLARSSISTRTSPSGPRGASPSGPARCFKQLIATRVISSSPGGARPRARGTSPTVYGASPDELTYA